MQETQTPSSCILLLLIMDHREGVRWGQDHNTPCLEARIIKSLPTWSCIIHQSCSSFYHHTEFRPRGHKLPVDWIRGLSFSWCPSSSLNRKQNAKGLKNNNSNINTQEWSFRGSHSTIEIPPPPPPPFWYLSVHLDPSLNTIIQTGNLWPLVIMLYYYANTL